ncbi:MAG: hypothetical protein A2992_04345 [Elusimicrobia bacterium RIFCSPLOWO2_01_FULL_59_12]|nr:MAG: hypothetical protein A2992_04345 [Elusimicrobia bacterium RIFCSPLOWO2_01_FULL_59_12]
MRIHDLIDIYHLPPASINLMLEKTAQNDPFYAQVVKSYYAEARSRHPKLFFVEKYKYGFSLCKMPVDFETYFSLLESPARGNHRKALRLGYEMKRFDFNTRLEDIREIWQSTPVRQGTLPLEIREGRVRPITHPPSQSPYHDYPYFGVFKDGKLLAYAGCLVAGDLCNLADFYGHDRYLNDGIVPLLIIEIARELYTSYPAVKIYSYGTYFGASESMRRFKRKFLFYPHKANWILSTPLRPASPEQERLIYRMDVPGPLTPKVLPEGAFIVAAKLRSIAAHFLIWVKTWGWKEALKTSLKVLSGSRILFGVIRGKRVVQFGWLNLGKCRTYPVERDAIVVETLWTDPQHRGQGLASATIHHGLVFLSQRGYRRFYVDTILANRASQRMIEKAGFSERVAC